MLQEKYYPVDNESKMEPIELINSIIIDTETTGLGIHDEVCEITV